MFKTSFLLYLFILHYGQCTLWSKGVVHYNINKKDYDLHSQDEIISTFANIQRELCVKFFNTPLDFNATKEDKLLYISNPDKRKTCNPENYNFNENIVDMHIGYKCINQKDITRMVVDMIKASIEHTDNKINSYDLIRRFQEMEQDGSNSSLLSPIERNYINANYHKECGELSQRFLPETRRRDGQKADPDRKRLSSENNKYYESKLWPKAIVMYSVDDILRQSKSYKLLRQAMSAIEIDSCIVFQQFNNNEQVLRPKSFLHFGMEGEELPALGMQEGEQRITLESMISGAPGHTAHAINTLMRVLGLPMMSNRYDRDNYINILWKNVKKGKEILLEKSPQSAWIQGIPYDMNSVTHAPGNFVCGDVAICTTVQPLQDHLWQRTLSMGHTTSLSNFDKETLQLLYGKQCKDRLTESDEYQTFT